MTHLKVQICKVLVNVVKLLLKADLLSSTIQHVERANNSQRVMILSLPLLLWIAMCVAMHYVQGTKDRKEVNKESVENSVSVATYV